MTKFAFCNSGLTLWQCDTAKPSVFPFPIHNGQSNTTSLALTADKQFEMVWGPSQSEIRKTKGTKTDTPVYTSPGWLRYVRVRNVGGKDRVYFSALKDKTSQTIAIYYLENGSPVLYTTIDPKDLPFPNPCDPSLTMYSYAGDFAFGDNDTLYLSSGNVMGPAVGMKVGVYAIDGAGPDSVTGTVKQIHLGDGPIQCLCYVSPQTLYFLRELLIVKLDLATMTESVEGEITMAYPTSLPRDLAYLKDGFPPAWTWVINTAVLKMFAKMGGFHKSAQKAAPPVHWGRPPPVAEALHARVPPGGGGAGGTDAKK